MKKTIKTFVAMLLAIVFSTIAYGCGKKPVNGGNSGGESSSSPSNTAYNITLLLNG